MPSAERYSKYRADQTTVWISRAAADFMARERDGREGTSAVLDRLINELKRHRRANPALAAEGRPAAKSAAKGGAQGGAKTAAKAAGKTASKGAAKGGAKTASKGAAKGASKGASKAAAKRA